MIRLSMTLDRSSGPRIHSSAPTRPWSDPGKATALSPHYFDTAFRWSDNGQPWQGRKVRSKPAHATRSGARTARIVSWLTPKSAASDRRLLLSERARIAARSSAERRRGRCREYGDRSDDPTARRSGGSETKTTPDAMVRAWDRSPSLP